MPRNNDHGQPTSRTHGKPGQGRTAEVRKPLPFKGGGRGCVQHTGRIEGGDNLFGVQIAHMSPSPSLSDARPHTNSSMNRWNLAESAFGQEWPTPGISTSLAPLVSAKEAAYACVVSWSCSAWMIVTAAVTCGSTSSRCK